MQFKTTNIKPGLITFLLVVTSSFLLGQYSPIEAKDLTIENYSRKEIRTYLLVMEPENSKVYKLARKSKNNKVWSYILYTISAGYIIGSVDGFNDLANNPDYDGLNKGVAEAQAWWCLGGAAVSLGLGILQTHNSRIRLNQALQQY